MKENSVNNSTQFFEHQDLSAGDKAILNGYIDTAKLVVNVFGSVCKVVVYSLHDLSQSVIYIHGDKTNRQIGSPISDKALKLLRDYNNTGITVVPPYKTKTENSKEMRSSTLIIKNPEGHPIGMFCINLDLQIPPASLVDSFFTIPEQDTDSEYFANNIEDIFSVTVCKVHDKIHANSKIPIRQKTRAIVEELNAIGVFKVKHSIESVAKLINVSRDIVYLHLRRIRQEEKQKQH